MAQAQEWPRWRARARLLPLLVLHSRATGNSSQPNAPVNGRLPPEPDRPLVFPNGI